MVEFFPRRDDGDKPSPASLFGGMISVNVRLCGSIPRQDMIVGGNNGRGGAPCQLRPVSQEPLNGLVFATTNGPAPTLTVTKTAPARMPTSTDEGETTRGKISSMRTSLARMLDGSISTLPPSATTSLPFADARGVLADRQIIGFSNCRSSQSSSSSLINVAGIVVEPPSWAVPASCGESRLEPVCDSVGRQASVDLTTRACFRIGRSPNSDIQLMHATSSRRHALLFHHQNGSCYVVDCGSAHGTYVNGTRIPSPTATTSGSGNSLCGSRSSGVVVPHKVRRGALIRFGGPGAPCFLLKSFNFSLNDLSRMSSSVSSFSSSLDGSDSDKGVLVRRNTRINALGRTAADHVRDSLFLTIDSALSVTRKRSFDSLDSRDTLDTVLPVDMSPLLESEGNKRLRCSSPPPSPEDPPLRLVSPDLPAAMLRSVSSGCHGSKRVSFAAEPPALFYPVAVTPDEAVPCIAALKSKNEDSTRGRYVTAL